MCVCERENKITRRERRGERYGPNLVCWQAHLRSAKGRRPPIQGVPPRDLFPQLHTGTDRGNTEAEKRTLSLTEKKMSSRAGVPLVFFFFYLVLLSFLSASFYISYHLFLELPLKLLVQYLWKQSFQETVFTKHSFIHQVKKAKLYGHVNGMTETETRQKTGAGICFAALFWY